MAEECNINVIPPGVIASQYAVNVTVFTMAGTQWQLILPRNAKRYYVRFEQFDTALATIHILPAPVQGLAVPGAGSNMPVEAKFNDGPSRCQADWYVSGTAGTKIFITEEIYLGD